jgi:hypothetical protein
MDAKSHAIPPRRARHQSIGCRGYTRDDVARIGLTVLIYSLDGSPSQRSWNARNVIHPQNCG